MSLRVTAGASSISPVGARLGLGRLVADEPEQGPIPTDATIHGSDRVTIVRVEIFYCPV
jgi:hypothetical protein